MRIAIDSRNPAPKFQQIAAAFREMILSRHMAPASRLPAARKLAADLGVNRLTVENAYSELEAEGLVYSRMGSGTYVLPLPVPVKSALSSSSARPRSQGPGWPAWQRKFEKALAAQPAPSTDSLNARGSSPTLLNLAAGVGDYGLFPAAEFRRVMRLILLRDGVSALEYEDPQGYPPLRQKIAQLLTSQGIAAAAESILVTNGSQQALSLVATLLAAPGDTVLVESPTYLGAVDLFRTLRLRVVGVPTDASGLRVDALEPLLRRHRPKFLYTIPTFHNPTGACLPTTRRRQLVALAVQHGVPILEDDFVGDLRYEGHSQPTLKSLDPGGGVIYVATFSKMLMPGLRVGFLMAEGPVLETLVRGKRTLDLASSSVTQRTLEHILSVGRFQSHLRRACALYRKRRDALMTGIRRRLPESSQYQRPPGGLFLWLRLPPGVSSSALLPRALAEGVSFVPGSRFFPAASEGEAFIRLNFAAFPAESFDEAMRRLSRAIG